MSAPGNPRAFPSSAIDDRLGGMTLRDWFAGQVLNHSLEAARLNTGEIDAAETADWAYQVADAMLAARVPHPEPASTPAPPSDGLSWEDRDPSCPKSSPEHPARACPDCWMPF